MLTTYLFRYTSERTISYSNFLNFLRLRRQGGIDPPNKNPADPPAYWRRLVISSRPAVYIDCCNTVRRQAETLIRPTTFSDVGRTNGHFAASASPGSNIHRTTSKQLRRSADVISSVLGWATGPEVKSSRLLMGVIAYASKCLVNYVDVCIDERASHCPWYVGFSLGILRLAVKIA